MFVQLEQYFLKVATLLWRNIDDDDDDNNNNNEPGSFLVTSYFSRQYVYICRLTPSIYGVFPSRQRLYAGGKTQNINNDVLK